MMVAMSSGCTWRSRDSISFRSASEASPPIHSLTSRSSSSVFFSDPWAGRRSASSAAPAMASTASLLSTICRAVCAVELG